MDNDKKIKKIINFAQSIRQKTIIYSLELQNAINYQYSELVNKPLFSFCTTDKTSVSKQFKRAFGKMSKLQQAIYYSKSLKTISEVISKKQSIVSDKLINTQIDIQKFVVDIKREGSFAKWTTCKIQIAKELNIIRIIPTNEELDLQNYLMRISKSKQKQAVVFQSIEDLAVPVSIKMTNNIGIFEDFRDRMQNYMDRAFTQKVIRLLKKNRLSTTTDKSIKASFTMPLDLGNQSITVLLCSGTNPKSLRKMISQSTTRQQNTSDITKIFIKLIDYDTLYNLSNFKGYEQMEPGLFYNKKQNVTRKLFVFNQFDISYEWLVTNMNCYKKFKKWKPSLFLINLLAEIPSQKTKIYHQINLYKDYTEVDYVFLRHMFQMDKNHYYIDKSIWTQQYGTIQKHSNSRGLIDYGLWRFRKIENKIQILVQIKLSNIKTKNIWQIASQYVGDVQLLQKQYKNLKDQKCLTSLSYKTVHNANLFLFQDESEINFDSIQNLVEGQSNKKQTQQKNNIIYDSNNNNNDNDQINELQNDYQGEYERSRSDTKFYTIYTSSSDDEQQIESSQQTQSNCNMQEQIKNMTKKITADYRQELSKCQPKTKISFGNCKELTKWHHIKYPQKKGVQVLRTSNKGHFLWQDQWKVTQKGELININKAQSQAQSGVLKSVLARMGRNLFSGKSILNISLPVQVFGTDTNLQRLCKCIAYAPRFVQKAATLIDPIQRLKQIICFSIGYGLLYIQMQKPFNPILGETYQAIIDGCPLYGQQISHHPPISSIYFQGRGYTIYGNFQAKVQMGMNSASGINAGNLCISFDKQNLKKNIIKFNTPPGEISGLIYGERKLTLIRKSYVLDVQNMLLAELVWGSIKKKNQLSGNNDYVQGRILKLKKMVQFQQVSKLKESDFQKLACSFKGRWTNKIFFQDKVLFDIEKDAPVIVNDYECCLESHSTKREDLILRKQLKWEQAQRAKQKLQQLQRDDRKLRKKYQKKH